MKLTWFGGRTMRLHVGGAILVGEPQGAPARIDRTELVSGADAMFEFDAGASASALDWKPRKAPTALEDTGVLAEVLVWQLGAGTLLIDAVGEPPLVLASAVVPRLGRWARDGVIVLLGEDMAEHGVALLEAVAPRLIVLAGADAMVDAAVLVLRHQLDGTGLLALEPGMALEV